MPLTVHAHPDDEASKGAGTVARYHAAGVHTVLVCCTGGEEGDILNPSMDTPEVRERLPQVRREELDRSAKLIGYDEVVMLGYRDSGMPGTPANENPDSFGAAPLDEAVGRLVAVVRRTHPQVMVIYPEEQTEYPHPDHLRAHEIGMAAFAAAGDAARFPSRGDPWQPLKLYYTAWPRERIRGIHQKFLELGLESPFDEKWLARLDRDTTVTTSHIDISGFDVRGGSSGPRHPGGPQLPLLVRTAARGPADRAPLRRLRPGPQLCRPCRGAGVRPVHRGGLRQP